jgi:hypothetical protein
MLADISPHTPTNSSGRVSRSGSPVAANTAGVIDSPVFPGGLPFAVTVAIPGCVLPSTRTFRVSWIVDSLLIVGPIYTAVQLLRAAARSPYQMSAVHPRRRLVSRESVVARSYGDLPNPPLIRERCRAMTDEPPRQLVLFSDDVVRKKATQPPINLPQQVALAAGWRSSARARRRRRAAAGLRAHPGGVRGAAMSSWVASQSTW